MYSFCVHYVYISVLYGGSWCKNTKACSNVLYYAQLCAVKYQLYTVTSVGPFHT